MRAKYGNGWVSLTPEQQAELPPCPDNEAVSALEVYEFKRDLPASYFLYVNEKEATVTTWMGDFLGRIVWAGSAWRSNMGDQRQAIEVRAINGRTYYGIYYCSAGNYARIKIAKEKSK